MNRWNLSKNLGLADSAGEALFHDEGDHSTTSRFVDAARMEVPPGTLEVAIDTLDNVLASSTEAWW